MQAASPLRRLLTSSKPAFGAWQMLAGTNNARLLARAGPDWICVDTEHGNISDTEMHEAVAAIAATPSCSPIVRIPAAEPWMVKRALDTGAHGVMVPLLQTAEEAKGLVRATKFPPRGMRGFGSPFAMGAFASKDASAKVPSAPEYLQQANDTLLTIIQIETREALENIEAIAATEGVDVLFVGPFDLGNNIGFPILEAGKMDEQLTQAIEKVRAAAKEKGKWSGIYASSGDEGRKWSDAGFDMISVTGDVIALQTHVTQQVGTARGSMAHSAYTTAKGLASRAAGQST
ncbi:MAG: hypothetical protein M1828_006433 [Chrysothrix sp. TS-e1954]|nr:MAG: hypothetical protein M1828_006433 [Chrysothrix sp. TS-e1954]